ncbi:MAG: hypothetical protein IT441_10645 [Phycisphaeraceae bacterium]|nr:hypothetical protein [Phycisphaeraceae bacterium]
MADVCTALIARSAGFAPDWSAMRLALEATGFTGRALAMRPGTWFPAGAVVAWFADESTARPASALPADLPWDFDLVRDRGTQTYRQLDDQGRFARDVMRRMGDDPIPGMVLLEEIWRENAWCAPSVGEAERQAWITRQSPAIPSDPAHYPLCDERKK